LLTVAIIGAGPLGRWLALSAARAGFRVLLEDVMPANLRHAREALRQSIDPAVLEQHEGPGGVSFVGTVEDAVRNADLAIDCVPDELESKLEIFCLLDRMAPPRTVLATPTTRLSIADLAACTYRADKCVAIAAEAADLADAHTVTNVARSIVIRTTALTSPSTLGLICTFWRGLAIEPLFEPDPLA
jgi:3-hydroxybutyryl-CoA dehydrogenase